MIYIYIECLVMLDKKYNDYCLLWEMSNYKLTQVCALFLKYIDSYHCGIDGTKKQNTWLLEKEGNEWIPGYKVSGKHNYVAKTLHQMLLLYGKDMTNKELG